MKKIVLTFFILIFAATTLNAQVIDIGQDTSSAKDNKTSLETTLKEDPKDSEKKDDGKSKLLDKESDDKSSGMFSFMNFSFFKKKPAQSSSGRTGEDESYLSKLIKSSDEGDVNAQLELGYVYLYGENGVKVNYKNAFKYYAKAAAQNDMVALNNLGSLYYSGIGVAPDRAKAAALFQKASDLGNSEASINLAFMYISGNGIYKNYGEAIKLFSKASAEGNPTASFMLGYAHLYGFKVPKDDKKAFELIREAAAAKYDDAQYIIARMYIIGQGISRNYGNAVKYYTQAASQGHMNAMEELADVLSQGKVYKQDLYRAYVIYNIAAVYGAPTAANNRNILESKLDIGELLKAQAEAEAYKEKPSELTSYIRQTFGENIKAYIEAGVEDLKKK